MKLEKEGYESLINKANHQGGINLKQLHKYKIKKWLEKDSNSSIGKIYKKLKKHFDLNFSRSTVHRAMKSVEFSYISPRKHPYKQDKIKIINLKKSSRGKIGV
jgi:transposase